MYQQGRLLGCRFKQFQFKTAQIALEKNLYGFILLQKILVDLIKLGDETAVGKSSFIKHVSIILSECFEDFKMFSKLGIGICLCQSLKVHLFPCKLFKKTEYRLAFAKKAYQFSLKLQPFKGIKPACLS